MAKGGDENIPCNCTECNGKEVSQVTWMLHNNHIVRKNAIAPDTVEYMGYLYVRTHRL